MSHIIEPIDFNRCQVDVPNGHSFMTIGGRLGGMTQCTNIPKYIIYELKEQEDGEKGAMSMCPTCKDIFVNRYCSNLNDYLFTEIIRYES